MNSSETSLRKPYFFILIGVAILFSILLLIISYFLGIKSKISSTNTSNLPLITISPTNTQLPQITGSITFPKEIILGKYNKLTVNNNVLINADKILSPNKQNMFFYDITDSSPPDLCNYAIYKKNGTLYEFLEKGNEQIKCSNEMFIYNYSFYKWIDNTHFIMEVKKGTIKLYDINNLNNPRILYIYNYEGENFVGVNDTYTQWLMRNSGENKDKVSLYLTDNDSKLLGTNFIFTSSDISHIMFSKIVPYDKINKGFILITRHYNYESDTTWGEFYFLDTVNLQLKKVKTGKSSKIQGRGCAGFDYDIKYSKIGEILIYPPSCLTINKDDIEADGTIKLTL